jgi:hypothetical protein
VAARVTSGLCSCIVLVCGVWEASSMPYMISLILSGRGGCRCLLPLHIMQRRPFRSIVFDSTVSSRPFSARTPPEFSLSAAPFRSASCFFL